MSIVKTELQFVCQTCGHILSHSVKYIYTCSKCGSKHLEVIARPVERSER